jgi:hypothetical protein
LDEFLLKKFFRRQNYLFGTAGGGKLLPILSSSQVLS